MALVECAGADVLRCDIHLLDRGCWWAELVLDTKTAPSGKQTIAASGGLSLAGTIYQAGVFLDAAHVRMSGGAAGMANTVPAGAYEQTQVRDPLNAIIGATGDSLSSTIDNAILSQHLTAWTQTAKRATNALDELVNAAGAALGKALTWRFLGDGTLWVGAESWSSATLPKGDDVLRLDPAAGLYEIGATTPSLFPGVNLSTVGKVIAVDHYVTAEKVRTIAWV